MYELEKIDMLNKCPELFKIYTLTFVVMTTFV